MKVSQELRERGFVHQFSSETVEEILDGEKRTVYHGIDPTADSAHAGNFVQWILLRHLVNAGHRVVFLVGGGTGRIGDPKPDVERTLVDTDAIDANVEKLKAQAVQLLGTDQFTFVNNNDWLGTVGLIEFLRDVGKHFTVNELIKKEAIARRMESEVGISYTEFAYPLLQAFDYLTLYREHGCDLQVGGSDQWGNIVAGVDLVRRVEQTTVYALTQPLVIDKTTGKKFGKSEGNAIWLDPEKTSPYVFYQFWLNVADENVIDFLKRFTFIPLSEIEEIQAAFLSDPGARVAQRRLAHEVTALVHGEETTQSIEKVSELLFGDGTIEDLSATEIALLLENAPTHTTSSTTPLLDVLVDAGLAASKREARTFITDGAITIGNTKVEDVDLSISDVETSHNLLLVRRGKKKLCVLQLEH